MWLLGFLLSCLFISWTVLATDTMRAWHGYLDIDKRFDRSRKCGRALRILAKIGLLLVCYLTSPLVLMYKLLLPCRPRKSTHRVSTDVEAINAHIDGSSSPSSSAIRPQPLQEIHPAPAPPAPAPALNATPRSRDTARGTGRPPRPRRRGPSPPPPAYGSPRMLASTVLIEDRRSPRRPESPPPRYSSTETLIDGANPRAAAAADVPVTPPALARVRGD